MDKEALKNFLELTRGYTLYMSLVPVLTAFVYYLTQINGIDFYILLKGFMLIIGVVAVHMFANLFDDYIDIQNKLKQDVPLNEINFHSKRKARVVLNGTFSIVDVEKILISLALLAGFVGIFFIFGSEIPVISYIILGVILTLFYPFSSKIGLSEIVIFLIFGPLIMNGSYYALMGENSLFIHNISIPMGLMITILAIVHSIMDYEFDKPTGKKTLPVILGKEGAITVIEGFIIISHLAAIIAFSKISPFFAILITLLFIFTGFISVKLITSLIDYINIKDVQFIPKWYLGCMENWEEIKNKNFEYYMYRFYLARNLAIFFGLANIIVLLIYLLFKSHPILTFLIFPHIFNITNILF